ncbi:MAG: TRAP transporter large permease subunit [Chloroflexota bacterium]
MRAVSKGIDKLLAGSSLVGTLILVSLAILVTAQVVGRYVLHVNMSSITDISIYAVYAFPFLTVAYTLSKNRHPSLNVLTSSMPERTKTGLSVATNLSALAFSSLLGWNTFDLAKGSFEQHVLTINTWQIPLGVLQSFMAYGCLLLTLQILRMLVKDISFLISSRGNQPPPRGIQDNIFFYPIFYAIGLTLSAWLFLNVGQFVGVFAITAVVLISGMPIFLALGVGGYLGLYLFLGRMPALIAPIRIHDVVFKFELTALPLFVLGGLIMERGKIVERMFKFFELMAGRYAPSLLIATVLVGLVFCATTGSTLGATVVVAAATYPELVRRGYNKALCAGLIGVATIGNLIPPSGGFIVFGLLTETSISQLFMGGFMPGVALFSFFILFLVVIGMVNKKLLFEDGKIPDQVFLEKVPAKAKLIAAKDSMWGILTPIIVLGGIYLGIFIPTESAAILVLYAVIVCVFVLRTVKWRDLIAAALNSAGVTSMVMAILTFAYVFAGMVVQLQIGPKLVAWSDAVSLSPVYILLIMLTILVIMGLFLTPAAISVMTLPAFFPWALAAGIDPVVYGVFHIILMEIGGLTPPVGVCVFALASITGLPLKRVTLGLLPFLVMMVILCLVIYFFPDLVLWLPGTMR